MNSDQSKIGTSLTPVIQNEYHNNSALDEFHVISQSEIGKYEALRYRYLKEHKQRLFLELFFQDKLGEHLRTVELSARNRLDQIMRCLLARHPAPDPKTSPLTWVWHMNQLKEQAHTIVVSELIYN
ncbi:TnpV protein [Acetobacterium wieringae]|uniref:TnpV protein n=1 Tax=Acetobacterium wieringae TaxID=52694 RepID=UPI0026EA51DB|nr:TnpV protein [Acetobacterium wieringae]